MSKAIFLGSFNPPHKGHYACIKSFIDSGEMEYLGIDKIHIIPCYQNPNKQKSTDYIHRYRMCMKMFADLIINEYVAIDDIEEEMCPKYTYELIDHFKSNKDPYIKEDFWWIITAETLQEIIDGKWRNSEQLLTNNKFIIMYNDNDTLYDAIQLVKKNKLNAVSIRINYDEQVNYHSTELREKIYNNESIANETNKSIQEYINENNLYKD